MAPDAEAARQALEVGQGASARVLRVSDHHVLKVFKPHLAPILVERELAFARLACDAGIPTPKPIEKQQYGSSEAILYEFCPGINLDTHTLPRPWRYRAASRQMADLHSAIHGVDTSAASRQLPASFRQKEFFRELIGYSRQLPRHLKHHCLERLEQLGEGSALCHGDMSPSNLMIHRGRCFVIDWSLATIGDPIGDVAFTWVGINHLSQAGDLNPLVKAILRRASTWYLQRYREVQGEFPVSELRRWMPPAAAARLGALEVAGGADTAISSLCSLIAKLHRHRNGA